MSGFSKSGFFVDKFQRIVSYFKDSSIRYLNFLYIFVFCVPVFLLTFQNCYIDEIDEISLPEAISGDYKIGVIAQVNSEGDLIEDQTLSVNSDIKLKFINADPDSDNYKWTIKRGFESLKAEESTSTNTYLTKFSKSGAYDVSANSYDELGAHKTSANKRFIVGDCALDDILEIELSSGSLKVGESATFGVRDSDNFSSFNWKITLGSREVTSTESTISVDISSIDVGSSLIEVSAVSAENSQCLTYRKVQVAVGSTLDPYFNPIVLTDGTNELPLMLESNDIYKYEKPDTGVFLQVQLLNADTCKHQVNQNDQTVFNCNGKSIPIVSSSDTGCIETQISILASNSESESSQNYYNYCGANDDYCYFSPIKKKQSHHICRAIAAVKVSDKSDLELDARTTTTTTTTQNSCSGDQHDSQTACDNANPNNSTCQVNGNGCYAWSCDDGYHRIGNTCENCPTSSSCNVNNPSNSSCQADGNGCYAWSCNNGYHRAGNACVNCPRSSTCNANNPSNSTCQADGNGCYAWSCNNGYYTSGNACVSCPTSSTCNANNPSNSSCQADGNGCYAWSCNNGYRRAGNACVSCPTSSTCNANNPSNSNCQADGNRCYAWSCNSGYRRSGNACVRSCSSGQYNSQSACDNANPSNSACSSQGGGCYAWSCNSGYRRSGNACVRSCSSGQYNSQSACDNANPSNSACSSQGGGCYAWSCNSGYRRSGNACVRSCSSGQYNSQSACDNANPSNSACSSQGGGCYTWSCNNGYRRSGNACVRSCSSGQYNSQSACDNANPSNSTCSSQGGECYAWSCNSGYRRSGNACVRSCSSGQYNSQSACDNANPSNSVCSSQGGGCYAWSCNSGYRRSGNACVLNEPAPECADGSMNCADGRNGSGCCDVGQFNEAPGDTESLLKWTCRSTGGRQDDCDRPPDPGVVLCRNGFEQDRLAYWLQDQPWDDCKNLNPAIVQRRGDRCNYAIGAPSGHTHVFQAHRCGGPWIETGEHHYTDTLQHSKGSVIKHVICECK